MLPDIAAAFGTSLKTAWRIHGDFPESLWWAAVIYCFEDFELDPARFELRKAGVPAAIEPQVLSLLLLLVSNP
jgi:hypothetical protein